MIMTHSDVHVTTGKISCGISRASNSLPQTKSLRIKCTPLQVRP